MIDFPVMPNEKMSMVLKPVSFFELNPSNDVPRSNQRDNQSTLHQKTEDAESCCALESNL